jgi:hypothetical protein
MRHPLGLTITVARQQSKTVSELSFLTAVHTARSIPNMHLMSSINKSARHALSHRTEPNKSHSHGVLSRFQFNAPQRRERPRPDVGTEASPRATID